MAPPFSTMNGSVLARRGRQYSSSARVLLEQRTNGCPSSTRVRIPGSAGTQEYVSGSSSIPSRSLKMIFLTISRVAAGPSWGYPVCAVAARRKDCIRLTNLRHLFKIGLSLKKEVVQKNE